MPPASPLAERRSAVGISQARLARRLGRSQPLISRWERGERSPTAADLVALAYELATEPEALIAGGTGPIRERRSRYTDRTLLEAIGHEIRRARHERGISPADALRRTGIAPRRLRMIESGSESSTRELNLMAGLIGMRISALLRRARLRALRKRSGTSYG